MNNIQQNIKAVMIAIIIALGVSYVAEAGVFTGPTCPPPNCNADAPINVGNSSQTKMGSLGVNSSAAPAFSVPNGVSLFKDIGSYNLSVLTTGDTNVGGIVFYPRNESSLLSTNQMQLYSPSKSIFAVWDNKIKRDVLKLNNGDVELTGKIKIAGGNPASGKVLKSDAEGNATWESPTSSVPNAVAGVFQFNARYWNMMSNSEFRNWFINQPNGPATIMPEGTGSDKARNWGNTQATASKLCQFFTDGGVISFTQTGTGSNNNNHWLYWDTAQNKWRWNSSGWNNSVDIETVTCFTMSGIVRGRSFLTGSQDNIPYSGNDTGTRDTY
jgi:hypothetical protein